MSALELRGPGGRPLNPFDAEVVTVDDRRDPRAARYHRSRLAEETRRKYRFYIELWLDFCALTGRREMPANAFGLEAFAIWLAQRVVTKGRNKGTVGLAPASILLALAAVRAFHEAVGENLPSTRLARAIVEGHEAERAIPGSGIVDGYQSPTLDLPSFAELVAACPPDTNAGLRDRALLTMGLNIMARRKELTLITLDGVEETRDGWLRVTVPMTKSGKPRRPYVPPWPDLPDVDPVAAHHRWVGRCAELGITDGPLYRAVDRHDNVQGAAGGVWAGRGGTGSTLDPATLESIILRAALAAQLPQAEELRPHGTLRASGAEIAYNLGDADVLAIARQGGWAENSPVVFRYIRNIDQVKKNAMVRVGQRGGSESS